MHFRTASGHVGVKTSAIRARAVHAATPAAKKSPTESAPATLKLMEKCWVMNGFEEGI